MYISDNLVIEAWHDLPLRRAPSEQKAHTKDPTPVSAENNSLGKKGAIAKGESFEEYLKQRAAQGK